MTTLRQFTYGPDQAKAAAKSMRAAGLSDDEIGRVFMYHTHDLGKPDGVRVYVAQDDNGKRVGAIVQSPSRDDDLPIEASEPGKKEAFVFGIRADDIKGSQKHLVRGRDVTEVGPNSQLYPSKEI